MRNFDAEIDALRVEIGRPSTRGELSNLALLSERLRAVIAWDASHPIEAARYKALLEEAAKEEAKAQAIQDERTRAERRLRKAEEAMLRSGIGARSNDAAKNAIETEALVVVRRWLPETGLTWLALCGSKGTGKSVAATWAVRETLVSGKGAAFRRTSEIAKLSQFEAGAADLESLKHVDLLVIDDFGAELLTDYAKAQIFELLDWRHENYGRTILTSNLQWQGAGGLKERLGERIVDRLAQCGRVVQLAADKSMRREK